MAAISVENLLKEIAPDQPSGPNLEYDAAFLAVERIAQGKPERQMGTQILPAEDPDWKKLREGCIELLEKTKHLRLVLYLCVSQLKMENLPGLRDGLRVLRGVVEKFWPTVYPELDPEDDNDPTERVNILESLARPPNTEGDVLKFQQRIWEVPLCESKQVGVFSYRDIAIAKGELAPTNVGDAKPPDMATIDAAAMDMDLELLKARAQAASECIEDVKAISEFLNQTIGSARAPNLSSFVSCLKSVQKSLDEFLSKRGVTTTGSGDAGEPSGASGEPAAHQAALSGEVRSRQDVLNAIDKISRYYDQYEPSSPVPLILGRARRLVTMNFMEIITDLSPDAIAQIQVISGVDKSAQGS